MTTADRAELVFVVDVSSLTKKGFVGTTKYEGRQIDLDFDDGSVGVFLDSEMAGRLKVKKGSKLTIIVEDEKNEVIESTVAGVGKTLRISEARVYYPVGREGGAIIRIRKG